MGEVDPIVGRAAGTHVGEGAAGEVPQAWTPAEGVVGRRGAASLFGVDPMTWRRWEREGVVRFGARVGRRVVYEVGYLRELIARYGRYGPPYPDPDRPGCYRVPLKGGDIRVREAIIDAESLPLVAGRRFNYSFSNDSVGYVALAHRTRPTPLRRMILGLADPTLRVSHLNGDPLDCRRANLLVRTMEDLARSNRKMGSVNGREYTSRFKGVCWETRTGRWLVQIRAHGKGRKIGRFDDEVEAAHAYDAAARELFGNHAYLNFPAPASRAA